MENKTKIQSSTNQGEQVPQGLVNRLNKSSVKSSSKFPVKVVIIFLVVVLFFGLGFGVYWYYSKFQILNLAKDMKWGWGTELTKYNVKTDFSLELKDIISEEQIPGFSLENGLILNTTLENNTVDENSDNNINLNITGALNAGVELAIKKINDNIYIKPEFNIDNPMINSFLDQFLLEEGEWLEISINNPGSFNFNTNLNEASYYNEKISEIISKLIEEDLLNIENPNNTIDSKDGELKEIQFSVKPEKFKDIYLIVGESLDVSREELLEEYEKESNIESKKTFEDIINNLKLSVFVNSKTKYIQGIGFNLKDFYIKQEGVSFNITVSMKTLLQTIEELDISTPQNIVTFKEVFEDRPRIKKTKETLEGSLEPVLNCLIEGKEINKPKSTPWFNPIVTVDLFENPIEDPIENPIFICEGSFDTWPSLDLQVYSYSNYYTFNVDENNYSWEYCAHSEELDDIQCKEDGCFGESCFEVLDESCEIVEECKIIIDTDNDGLSDEEEVVYGTDINNPDTDGDGYLDGEEVSNGYNPLGEGLLE